MTVIVGIHFILGWEAPVFGNFLYRGNQLKTMRGTASFRRSQPTASGRTTRNRILLNNIDGLDKAYSFVEVRKASLMNGIPSWDDNQHVRLSMYLIEL